MIVDENSGYEYNSASVLIGNVARVRRSVTYVTEE